MTPKTYEHEKRPQLHTGSLQGVSTPKVGKHRLNVQQSFALIRLYVLWCKTLKLNVVCSKIEYSSRVTYNVKYKHLSAWVHEPAVLVSPVWNGCGSVVSLPLSPSGWPWVQQISESTFSLFKTSEFSFLATNGHCELTAHFPVALSPHVSFSLHMSSFLPVLGHSVSSGEGWATGAVVSPSHWHTKTHHYYNSTSFAVG